MSKDRGWRLLSAKPDGPPPVGAQRRHPCGAFLKKQDDSIYQWHENDRVWLLISSCEDGCLAWRESEPVGGSWEKINRVLSRAEARGHCKAKLYEHIEAARNGGGVGELEKAKLWLDRLLSE